MLTSQDVRRHASRGSCWVIISNHAYDVTDFLDQHPGGANTILRYAGKDATEEYEPIHAAGTLDKHLSKDKHLGPVRTSGEDKQPEKSPVKPASSSSQNLKDYKIPPQAAQSHLSILQNLDDFESEARKVLPEKAWIYYSSATDTLSAHAGNLSAFSKVLLRPRVLRNVAQVSTLRTVMGHPSALPIFIAPAAQARLGHPDGELCLVRAAAMANIPYSPSTYSSIAHAQLANELERLNSMGGDSGSGIDGTGIRPSKSSPVAQQGAIFPQLYAPIDKRKGMHALIAEARRLKLKTLVITVDSAVIGKREEDERYKARLDVAAGLADNAPSPSQRLSSKATNDGRIPRGAHSSTLEWDDLEWIRVAWANSGPIILKGLATLEDVVEAAQRGVQGVYLSNHGGRQLDYAPSSLHTLLEIRRFRPELLDVLDVYVDGGFRRGTDVVKALCLGARAVGIGRPFMYSLSGYGTEGVCRAVEILRDEIQTSMRLLGVTDVNELDISHVNPSMLDLEIQGITHRFSSGGGVRASGSSRLRGRL